MPKMKSRSSVAKRYRLTASGKIKRKKAFRSHILSTKSRKRKRELRRTGSLCGKQAKNIKVMLSA